MTDTDWATHAAAVALKMLQAEVAYRIESALRFSDPPHYRLVLSNLRNGPLTFMPETIPEVITHLVLDDTNITELDGAKLPKGLVSLSAERAKLFEVRNLDRLVNLRDLNLTCCVWLDHIDGELPPHLWSLHLRQCLSLTRTPRLVHTRLQHLSVDMCEKLSKLPELPETLVSLIAQRSAIPTLPYLPDSLAVLHTDGVDARGTAALIPIRDQQRKALRKERFDAIHEELMMVAWHPKRVEAWLTHGEHTLDMMMGC
jgi:hypothetical protein